MGRYVGGWAGGWMQDKTSYEFKTFIYHSLPCKYNSPNSVGTKGTFVIIVQVRNKEREKMYLE